MLAHGTTRPPKAEATVDLWGRAVLVVAAALVLYAMGQPLWGMTMHAPQYPGGLQMIVGPGYIEGDLGIINVLNHYVGMREIHLEDFWELQILPYLLGGWAAIIVLAAVSGKRKWAVGALIVALLLGAVGAADLKFWLWNYGNNLEPYAPLDLDPFTPPIVGEYEVWNFQIFSAFGQGAYFLALAGALVAFVVGRSYRWGSMLRGRLKAGRRPTAPGRKGDIASPDWAQASSRG